ncbi:YHS domain-containing protein [Rhizobiales bacterium GAS188]|nr:YHS domain-containing protein [Rhizobiales bacterium GAS188]
MDSWIWLLIVGGLFFLMMRFGCGAQVMGRGHRDQGDHRNPMPGRGPSLAATASAIDPVCGMHMDPALAKSSVYRDEVYFFCSTEHRTRSRPIRTSTLERARSRREQHVHG